MKPPIHPMQPMHAMHPTRGLLVITMLGVLGACGTLAEPLDARAAAGPGGAALHTELALAYLSRDRPAVARNEARRAVALAPRDVDAWHALALTEVGVGDMPSARRHFERALGLRSDDATLLANYGTALCASGQRTAGAALLGRAAQLEPLRESAHPPGGVAGCGAAPVVAARMVRDSGNAQWRKKERLATRDRRADSRQYLATRDPHASFGDEDAPYERGSRDE